MRWDSDEAVKEIGRKVIFLWDQMRQLESQLLQLIAKEEEAAALNVGSEERPPKLPHLDMVKEEMISGGIPSKDCIPTLSLYQT